MHRFLRFSLKIPLVVITIVAIGIYFFWPIETEINCDIMPNNLSHFSNSSEPLIDIQGRNKAEPFVTIVERAKFITSEPILDPAKGNAKVTFQSTLYGSRKLKYYEIFRVRDSR